jgi:cysteine desulfurase
MENARDSIAEILNVSPQEVIFTSGASEGIAIAILGVLAKLPPERRGIILSATEHKAVLQAAATAQELFSARMFVLDVDENGILDFQQLESQLASGMYGLVAVMRSNNETGVIQDTELVSKVTRLHNALFFCDVTQSIGKEDVGVVFRQSDIAVFTAHKFYGPKGSGALYATRSAQQLMQPMLGGGGQERGLRGGTPNVPGIVGLNEALSLAMDNLSHARNHFRLLGRAFRLGLRESGIDFVEVGSGATRLENTINLRMFDVEADALMANMPQVEVATGSACNSAVVEPSHVLLAHGLSTEEANQCVRVSFGKDTSIEEVHFAVAGIVSAVARIRQIELAV